MAATLVHIEKIHNPSGTSLHFFRLRLPATNACNPQIALVVVLAIIVAAVLGWFTNVSEGIKKVIEMLRPPRTYERAECITRTGAFIYRKT
jgi:hypothetical protein